MFDSKMKLADVIGKDMWGKVERLVGKEKLAPPPKVIAPPAPPPPAQRTPPPVPPQPAVIRTAKPPAQPENPRTQQIRALTQRRSINHVLHFTRLSNIASIVQHGLLPRHTLSTRRLPFTHNDDIRLDGALDASCLTLSWPNHKMFYRYRTANPTVSWVVLSFKADVLWELDCAFCLENAASNRARAIPLRDRKSANALETIFLNHEFYPPRDKLRIPDNFPTNPQAEILIFGSIPKSLIQVVLVPSETIGQLVRAVDATIPTKVSPNAFSPRLDWEFWRPSSSPFGETEVIF